MGRKHLNGQKASAREKILVWPRRRGASTVIVVGLGVWFLFAVRAISFEEIVNRTILFILFEY